MADVPQLEDGHIRIANDLWDAWMSADLTGAENRVLMFMLRQSYGWARKDTAHYCGRGAIRDALSLNRATVTRAIKGLRLKHLITIKQRGGIGQPTVYEIQKDWRKWSPTVLPDAFDPGRVETPRRIQTPRRAETPTLGAHRHLGVGVQMRPKENQEEPRRNKRTTTAAREGRIDVHEIYIGLGGRGLIPSMQQPKWIAIGEQDVEEVQALVQWAAMNTDNPLRAFLGCFDDSGTITSKRRPKSNGRRRYKEQRDDETEADMWNRIARDANEKRLERERGGQ